MGRQRYVSKRKIDMTTFKEAIGTAAGLQADRMETLQTVKLTL